MAAHRFLRQGGVKASYRHNNGTALLWQAPAACIRPAQRRWQPGLPVRAQLAGAAGGHGGSSSASLLGGLIRPPSPEVVAPYLQLARIHNLVPSVLLVLVGAWAGSGRSLAALHSPSVWLTGLLSGGVTVASMVVNDYFDLRADAINAPSKPLPSGAVTPDAALLLSGAIYCAVLATACCMEPCLLRYIVALSATVTLLYTPVFKRLAAVKNATVATVVALAPLAGALAAGAGEAGVYRLLPATIFAFSGVFYREVMMDLNDLEGDRASGVWTLPVLLGKPAAAGIALGVLAAGGSAVLHAACLHSGGSGAVLAAVAAVLAGALGSMVRWTVRVARNNFDHNAVDAAVGGCLKPIGLGIILLAGIAS